MTTSPALFTPNGDGYDIQPAGVLMLLAGEVYGSEPSKQSPKLKSIIGMFLSAARTGGFQQVDILETLLARGEVSHRVKDMAVAACNAAGPDAIDKIFAAMRVK